MTSAAVRQGGDEHAPVETLARLRGLLDAVPVGLAELDDDGRLVLANRTLETLADRRWYELLGRRWTVLAHHYDRPGVEQLWASAAPSQVQLRATFRAAVAGDDRWVEALAAPGPGGGWLLVLTDAGERVASSAALVDSERWLRAVLDAVPVGLAVHTLEGRAMAVNETMARTLGSRREELAAALPGEFPCTDEAGLPVAPADQPAARAVATGEPVTAVLGVEIGGQRRWLQVSAQALPLHDDSLARGVVTTAVDLTAHRARTEALAACERRHHALLEAAGDVVLELGVDGRCVQASGSAGELLGVGPGGLLGLPARDLVHPEDADALDGLLTEQPGARRRPVLRVRRGDGTYARMQAVATTDPAGNDEGREPGWLLQLRDVEGLLTSAPAPAGTGQG